MLFSPVAEASTEQRPSIEAKLESHQRASHLRIVSHIPGHEVVDSRAEDELVGQTAHTRWLGVVQRANKDVSPSIPTASPS